MRSAKDIAELDEQIRRAQYQLDSLRRRRDRWMQERNDFKKLIYRNRKRKSEAQNALQVS
jgi:chromosome segregation ATPase